MIRLICGPPCAGKTTHVRQRAGDGDLVIDLDELRGRYGPAAPAVRAALEDAAATHPGDVWVIRTLADPGQRADAARRLGAEEVHVLTVPADEAIARADRDGRPDGTADVIRRWWAEYRPAPVDQPAEDAGISPAVPAAGDADGLRSTDMGENAGTGGQNDNGGQQGAGQNGPGQPGSGGQGTFSQADVDRIVAERLSRERGKYADYDEIKAKATKLDELEQANQSEAEKMRGQLEDALGKATRTQIELWRERAARQHGLSDEDMQFVTGDTEEQIAERAKAFAERLQAHGGGQGGNAGQNGAGAGGGQNGQAGAGAGGDRRPDLSQGRGSGGDGTRTLDAGRDRYQNRNKRT